MNATRNESCEARIGAELADVLLTLRRVWAANQGEPEQPEYDEDGESNPDFDPSLDGEEAFSEYGLSFDYVAPETFGEDQEEGYFRYQLSWGGPSDEFRFYVSPSRHGFTPHRVEYWFMDWFDGASRRLYGADRVLLDDIFEWFNELDLQAMVEAACE